MRKPAGRGLLLGLAPLGPFARGAEIDKVAHAKFGGNQMCGLGHPGLFGLEELRRYGDAGSRQLRAGAVAIQIAMRECGYTDWVRQVTVAREKNYLHWILGSPGKQ